MVANEIRNLSEQSKQSAKNINNIIKDISRETDTLVSTTNLVSNNFKDQIDIVDSSISTFKEIISDIENMLPKISSINFAAEGINKEKNIIMENIQTTSSISEETSAASEEMSAFTEEVTASSEIVSNGALVVLDTAKLMNKEVNRFIF